MGFVSLGEELFIYCSPHSPHYDGGKFGHYSLQIPKIKILKRKEKRGIKESLNMKKKGRVSAIISSS